jgi:hypothetical protein
VLACTLYELLQHPKVEQQLLREVLGPLPAGSSSSRQVINPSYDQIMQLRFTRACFLEALRLHPSIPNVRLGSGCMLGCSALSDFGWVFAQCQCPFQQWFLVVVS